jgi:formylglycine-generating enzyme required for sulfatase activity
LILSVNSRPKMTTLPDLDLGFVVSVSNGDRFLGSGVLLNERQVLTCRHVVEQRPVDSRRRSSHLREDVQVGFHAASPGAGDPPPTLVPVEAILEDPAPLDEKLDLAVLTLRGAHPHVTPAHLLVGVGQQEWSALAPAVGRACVVSRCGVLPLAATNVSADFRDDAVSELQVTGHGAVGGYSGGAAMCAVAQHWTCLGIPFLGGPPVTFTKLLGSDRVAGFLRARGVRFASHDARDLAPVVWATAAGRDAHGPFADFELATIRHRMRWIPPGRFRMRSEAPAESQEVELTSGFWLGETTCPQELWDAVSAPAIRAFPDPAHPAVGVSWDDCARFLARAKELAPGLQLRLPTEAEWEHACRAGSEAVFSSGESLTPDLANLRFGGPDGRYRGEPAPVRSHPPNRHGLHEMHGNVWEWCGDWYGPYQDGLVKDPAGPLDGDRRILRGGSWATDPTFAQSGRREAQPPGWRRADVGFRLARSAAYPPR